MQKFSSKNSSEILKHGAEFSKRGAGFSKRDMSVGPEGGGTTRKEEGGSLSVSETVGKPAHFYLASTHSHAHRPEFLKHDLHINDE